MIYDTPNDILACDTLLFVLLRSLETLQKQSLVLNAITIDRVMYRQFDTNSLQD